MALPGDVTKFDLTFGHSTNGYTDATGAVALVGTTAKLFPVDLVTGRRLNVTHVASGQVIIPTSITVTIDEDGKASVGPLPHTDNETLSPIGFGYRVEWQVASGRRRAAPDDKTFAAPTDAGATVDFDLLGDADAVPGVVVPIGVGPQGPPGVGTTPAGPAGGALDGSYPNPGLNTTAVENLVVGSDAVRAASVAAVTRPSPLDVHGLPVIVDGARNFNSTPFQQDSVRVVGDQMFALAVGRDRKPWICQYRFSTGAWTTFDLSTIAAAPLGTTVADDGHCVFTMGIDSAGRIHVAGGMHDIPLQYARSTNPLDITTWTAGTMIGTEESSVTYPTFVTAPNGDLLFFYRQGVSGLGNLYLNRWTGSAWSRVALLMAGTSTSESPYWDRIAVADGTIHVTGCWRGTGFANTNNDVFHIKSTDNGSTWKNTAGTTLSLPVGHTGQTTVVDTAPTNSGLINTCGLAVDTAGRIHKGAWLNDSNGTQLAHIWYDGTWHTDLVTAFTTTVNLAVGSLAAPISRPQVVCSPDGRTFLLYRSHVNGYRGTLRMMDVTPSAAGLADLGDFPISNIDHWYAEPTATVQDGQLVLLAAVNAPDTVAANADLPSTDLWRTSSALVYMLDLTQLDKVTGGLTLPGVRVLTSGSGTGTATGDSPQPFTGGPLARIPERRGDRMLVARAHAHATLKGAAGNIHLVSAADAGSGTVLGTFKLARGRNAVFTPWLPLDVVNGLFDGGGSVSLRADTDGAVVLHSATVEVGIVEGGRKGAVSGPNLTQALATTGGVLAGSRRPVGQVIADWDASVLAGTTDATEVTSLPDAGPFGFTMTAPAGFGPTYSATGYSGKPCLVFAGAQRLATAQAVQASTDYTVIVVGQATATPASSTLVSIDTSAGNLRQFQIQAASGTALSFITFNTAASANTQSGAGTTTDPFVAVLQSWYTGFNSRGVSAFVNGTKTSSAVSVTGAPVNNSAIASIGARNGATWTNPFTGRIARVIILSGRVPDVRIAAISTALAADPGAAL